MLGCTSSRSCPFEEHLSNLREVFTRQSKAGLKLKPSKCTLVQKELDFLGYVVSANGISADPKKVAAVTEYPTPADLKALWAFLGLTSYYRRFVPSFSTVAQPLYSHTQECSFLVVQRVPGSFHTAEDPPDPSTCVSILVFWKRLSS